MELAGWYFLFTLTAGLAAYLAVRLFDDWRQATRYRRGR